VPAPATSPSEHARHVTAAGATSPGRRVLFSLVTVLVAVGLALATLELLSWGFFRSRELLDQDLRVFCKPRSGGMPIATKRRFVQRWTTDEFDVTIRTNSLGLREDFELPAGGRVDVGFLGDSFTFGHGVNAGQRFSDVVRAGLRNAVVVSFGYADGFTTPHYYLYLKERPALIPRVAVVALFLGNDLSGDMMESELIPGEDGDLVRVEARYREPDALGRLVTRDRNPVNRMLRRTWTGCYLLYLDRQLGLNLEPLRPDRAIPLYGWVRPDLDLGKLDDTARDALRYVAKIRDLVRAHGGETVMLLVPPQYYIAPRYHSPHANDVVTVRVQTDLPLVHAIETWCSENELTCVDPISHLRRLEQARTRTYFYFDGHLTAAGHTAVAMALLPAVTRALAASR